MKKCAIAIIGLVFAAFIFGACKSDGGGKLKVKNADKTMSVNIYVTNVMNSPGSDDTKPPEKGVVAEKKYIKPGETEEIKINEEGGPYYIKPFFIKTSKIPELDEDGNQKLDEEDNPIYKVDEEGNIIYEEIGMEPGKADPSMVYMLGDTEEVTVTRK